MEVRKLIVRVVWLALPFAVFSLFITAVDPYDQYRFVELFPSTQKVENLFKHEDRMVFSDALYKLNQFEQSNAKNVIFGDSRLSRFPEAYATELSGEPLFNFGITGGNYHSMFQSFWLADSLKKLEKVYFQVSYRIYSKDADWPVLESPRKVSASWIEYVTDRRVIASTFELFSNEHMTMDSVVLDQADWTKKIQIERKLLEIHEFDPSIEEELARIAAHCRFKGIELVLIDFPSHSEVIDLYSSQEHIEKRLQYLKQVSKHATLYDFCNADEPLTQEKSDFRDPLHSSESNNRQLIERIWGEKALSISTWKNGKQYR